MLLLVWSLVTSQCVICPAMQAPQPAPHDCCKPPADDHCGTQQPSKPCPGHSAAFESSPKIETAPLMAIAGSPMLLPSVAATLHTPAFPIVSDSHHAPPDRCLLNSVLLI
jgi:hypothetical protein